MSKQDSESIAAGGSPETTLQGAARAAGVGLWTWDLGSNHAVWNEPMHTLTGHDTPLTLPEWIEELTHSADRADLTALCASLDLPGPFPDSVSRIVRSDGEIRWVVMSGQVLSNRAGGARAVVGACSDVTSSQRAAQRLAQAERMETIGHLAAGVAHNFNNMLMIISPCLETLQHELNGQHESIVRDALHATERSGDIVRQLMLIAGQGDFGDARPQAVGTVAADVVRICDRLMPAGMALKLVTSSEPTVNAAEGTIEQVLTNLILNARDALVDAGTSEPTITIEVAAETHFDSQWARVLVRDNGPGISPELESQIFAPFFTTKPGRGAGLGLSTSEAIATQLAGQLVCRSTPGETEFLLLVPAIRDNKQASMAGPPPAPAPLGQPTAERILLIDDEPAICRAIGNALRRSGMHVISASSAEDVELVLRDAQDFELVLLDRSLGSLSGTSLIATLRTNLPAAKILFFTGQHIAGDELGLVDGVLHKPIGGTALVSAIRKALQA